MIVFPMEEPQGPVLRTSVLVLSRNAAAQLQRCLASVEASQGRETIEIIVVDMASREGIAEVEAQFPNASFLRLPKDFGRTKAANIGIRTAKGEFVLITDPWWEFAPATIPTLVARLESDPEAGAVCPRVDVAHVMPGAAQLYEEWKDGTPLPAVPIEESAEAVAVGYPRGAPVLIRRNFLQGMRFLNERFGEFGSDLDMYRQIRHAGKKVLVLPAAQVTRLERPEPRRDSVAISDHALGIAAYAGKYEGSLAGWKQRLRAVFTVLGRALLFRGGWSNWELLFAILGAQKIDGEQPEEEE